MPIFQLNYTAIIIAVIANFIFGFLWYTPLFGKAWAKEMGFDTSQKAPLSSLLKGLVLMIIGNFLMAYVFAHNIKAWDPASWGQAPSPLSDGQNAAMAAVFTWLGFYVPTDLSVVGWENKSWRLFFINTGYHFFMVLIAALILTFIK